MKMYRAVVVDLTTFVTQDLSVGKRTATCPDHYTTIASLETGWK
jgi:hypothetical protein